MACVLGKDLSEFTGDHDLIVYPDGWGEHVASIDVFPRQGRGDLLKSDRYQGRSYVRADSILFEAAQDYC